MAVERRGKRKQYLYRSERVGKRIVKRYVGSLTDPVTTAVARLDRLAYATRSANRKTARQEVDSYAALEPVIRVTSKFIARLVWRHLDRHSVVAKQSKTARKEKTMKDDNMPKTTLTREDFDELVARVSIGGDAALDELRRVLRANPSIHRALGDLDTHVRDCLVEQIVGQSAVATECLRLRLADLRIQLDAGDGSPLERLLVEHVITTWLSFNVLQVQAGQPHHRKTDAKHWDQRLDRAQRRHLAPCWP